MSVEREIYSGLTRLGTVRERDDGSFVAVIAEEVIGPFDTAKQATDALLELVRSEGDQ